MLITALRAVVAARARRPAVRVPPGASLRAELPGGDLLEVRREGVAVVACDHRAAPERRAADVFGSCCVTRSRAARGD